MQQIRYTTAFLLLFSLISFQNAFGQADTNKFSDFAQQIPRANTEILAVNNVAEHVESILNHKALRRVMTQNDLGDFDMDEVLENFQTAKPYFPNTIALSSNDELYSAILKFAQVMLLANVAIQSQIEEDVDEAEMKLLRKEIAGVVTNFKIPDVTAWLTWSDEDLAKTLFANFKQQTSIIELLTNLDYKSDATSFRISGTVANFADEETIVIYLDSLALEDPDQKVLSADT